MIRLNAPAGAFALALLTPVASHAQVPAAPTPDSITAEAQPGEWIAIPPADLLVMKLAPDARGEPREVVIQLLPPPFSQGWVDNIKTLAAAHWWDGTSVYRVVDNWVAQWGDGKEDKPDPKPLPPGLTVVPESAYVAPIPMVSAGDASGEPGLATSGIADGPISTRDAYAPLTGFENGWPIALSFDSKWPTHCYGTVGVARDLSPDTGTGAELYAVIGHAPRQLDRNIAVVGRVIDGIEYLATLPRGTAEFGVYATEEEHTPIVSVRLASELPPGEQPAYQYLDTASASFARYAAVRAARHDDFYRMPAGGVDVCNVQVPIRKSGPSTVAASPGS